MDTGIIQSAGQPVAKPLPTIWLKLPTAPLPLPDWAKFGRLSAKEVYNLLAQIGYDQSQWNYYAVGPDNQLGNVVETPGARMRRHEPVSKAQRL
jgi:hypothetical protein